MVGGGAVHVGRLQLHLAGGDGCVELHLSPVHDVEHQADADDDLREGGEGGRDAALNMSSSFRGSSHFSLPLIFVVLN